jgi:hypothetical protein
MTASTITLPSGVPPEPQAAQAGRSDREEALLHAVRREWWAIDRTLQEGQERRAARLRRLNNRKAEVEAEIRRLVWREL